MTRRDHCLSYRHRKMLRLRDLHPLFASVTAEEARLIANLGATVYESAGSELRRAWAAELSAEEGAKADVWRREGRLTAMEEIKGQLADATETTVRLAAAEGTVAALRSSMDEEVTRRVGEALEGFRKDYELSALKEVAALREQLAVAKMREELLVLMQEKVEVLQAQVAEQTASKSSHVIGKQGEATVWEMLEGCVVPEFPYAEARNMSGVSHAADFHLWVMRPDGKRMKVLLDAKKYKRPVNTEEINKLNADVDGDDEAHCGILISLTSPVCGMKQFQMRVSDKGKPVLYLSFMDLEKEYQTQLLCWGVRALMTTVREVGVERSLEAEQVDELLTEICGSLKEVDSMIRTHAKMIETLRSMKGSVLQKIANFKQGVSAEEGEVIAPDEGCVAIVKATGDRCGRKVVEGDRCGNHRVRKAGQS